MSSIEASPGQSISRRQRPIWHAALIVLVALLILSESAYLLAGMGAKGCIDSYRIPGIGRCEHITAWPSHIFFAYAENAKGIEVFAINTSLGLPGFNTLFYMVLGSVDADMWFPFIMSGLAALLVAFLALWGFLTMSAGRGALMKLLIAGLFAAGWVAFNTVVEASIYSSSFMSMLPTRYFEIAVAFLSLAVVALFARRRDQS